MKCEIPAGGSIRHPIEVIEIGKLSDAMRDKIEAFRFPHHEFSSPAEREKELYYDRLYLNRAVYVIYYSPVDPTSFVAVARIIEKRSPEEKLPVEFATVISTTVDSTTSPKRDIAGSLFPVDYYDNRFPVCEIGGLRAAEIDTAKGITLKVRYRALDEVMKQCDKQVHDRGYKSFFLTCVGTPQLERLYHDKFFFNEVATISYGTDRTSKALWRVPFHNPARKVEYSQKSNNVDQYYYPKPRGIGTCTKYVDESIVVRSRELELVY